MFFIGDPAKCLTRHRRKGEIAFGRAVAELLDRADRMAQRGRIKKALPLYAAVASLQIDDGSITEAVDHARRFLEGQGVSAEPSVQAEYQRYLASLPPFNRHIRLARQALRKQSKAPDGPDRAALMAEAVEHFQKAQAHGRLSSRDQRILEGLRRGLGA